MFPTRERPLKPYAAAARAALETRPLMRELGPDVVVNDVLTLAPALAAELEGVPWATLVPHFYPPARSRAAALRPRRDAAADPLGRAAWRLLRGQTEHGRRARAAAS